MSDVASKVVSIEEVKDSVELARKIIEENGIDNIELHQGDAGKFLSNETLLGRQYHVTILDPPRKGCTPNSLDYALKLTQNKIIYVSCNPATLARDLKYLHEHGAEALYIQPFDMFPHTYHIENVAIIDLKNVKVPEIKLP
jgi:23S rRNA (uracil1939-C5)-methyltransferase